MMEHAYKIIYIALYSILFSLGLIFLITITNSYHTIMTYTKDAIKEDVLYQQSSSSKKQVISRAEIIASLFQPLEYDIKIDDILIEKSKHSKDQISNYEINGASYNQSYQYDQTGNIVMIIYQRCGAIE